MYKQYLNDYEKRADQIRKAARAIEAGENTLAVNTTASKKNMFISKRSNDPISDIIKTRIGDHFII